MSAIDEHEFARVVQALPVTPKRQPAAAIVREHLVLLRERRREGVDEQALLNLINDQAQSPISLVTLRCYLARGARSGPPAASPARPEKPLDFAQSHATVTRVPQLAPIGPAPPLAGPEQNRSARTEQRGITAAVRPGPVR